jgi:hypothetical protein
MNDEFLAGLAALVSVVDAGVDERLLDPLAVDRDRGLFRVLLDDREQIAEQSPLGLGQLYALDRSVRRRILDDVDRSASARDQRRLAPAVTAAAALPGRLLVVGLARLVPRRTSAQSLSRRFPLLRNRCPSSYRCA